MLPITRHALVLGMGVLAAAHPVSAGAQTNDFDLLIDGKSVGRDTFTIKPSHGGYNLSSRYTVHVPVTANVPVQLIDRSDDLKLTGDYRFTECLSQDHVSLSQHTAYTFNKAGDELSVLHYGSGSPQTDLLRVKPGLFFLTVFDAGTAQAVLLGIAAKPQTDDVYPLFFADDTSSATRAIVNSQQKGGNTTGSAAPFVPYSQTTLEPPNHAAGAKWIKGKDASGTLDNKPLLLHTYLLAFGRSRFIFYADEANKLMVFTAPDIKAVYLRTGFKLNIALPPASVPGAGTP